MTSFLRKRRLSDSADNDSVDEPRVEAERLRSKVRRLSRADTESTEERMQRLETDRVRSQTRRSRQATTETNEES